MRIITLIFLLLFGLAAQGYSQAPGYTFAAPGREWSFPRDHGSHPEFRTEWWYFTGNVATGGGREFGYELTIFRNRIAPMAEGHLARSPLYADEVFAGHFAISDITNRRHGHWENAGRAGLGQAFAATDRLHVKSGPLEIEMNPDGTIRLAADKDGAALDFLLTPAKSFVLHGEDGYHRKGNDPREASHYITFTRLDTRGTLRWEGREHAVAGLSWFDHEFFSQLLNAGDAGWDWFALQFEDGTDLMVYQLRTEAGVANEHAKGSWVDAGGNLETFPVARDTIRPNASWTSPHTGAVYPMGWEIRLPERDLVLTVTPRFEDQEMRTSRFTGVIYWEGAVAFEGTQAGRPVRGKGYVELVGYHERAAF